MVPAINGEWGSSVPRAGSSPGESTGINKRARQVARAPSTPSIPSPSVAATTDNERTVAAEIPTSKPDYVVWAGVACKVEPPDATDVKSVSHPSAGAGVNCFCCWHVDFIEL